MTINQEKKVGYSRWSFSIHRFPEHKNIKRDTRNLEMRCVFQTPLFEIKVSTVISTRPASVSIVVTIQTSFTDVEMSWPHGDVHPSPSQSKCINMLRSMELLQFVTVTDKLTIDNGPEITFTRVKKQQPLET